MFNQKPFAFPLLFDNQVTIALLKDNKYQTRTKHIDIDFHFICQEIENNRITLSYYSTEEMRADTLMKALPSLKVKHFALSFELACI